MFSINCLEILNNSKSRKELYKILKPQKYLFNDYFILDENNNLVKNKFRKLSKDFFGENIHIQAIVGKNGSGKSTLIELMLMAINNFAFMIQKKTRKGAVNDLFFVEGLYIILYFNKGEKEFELCCKGESVYFMIDNQKIDPSNPSFSKKLISEFFYSIITNYSFQSFLPDNYKIKCSNSQGKQETHSWISPLFHKNDSYKCPIVINPKRTNGTINLYDELQLSKDRLLGLMLYAYDQDFDFDGHYQIDKIVISNNYQKILSKTGFKSVNELAHCIQGHISTPNSTLNIILNYFNEQATAIKFHTIKYNRNSNTAKKLCIAYIMVKIFSIVEKYDSYKAYRHGARFDIERSQKFRCKNKENLTRLLKQLCHDSSHITLKLRRAIIFMALDDQCNLFKNAESESFSFDYKNYHKELIALEESRLKNFHLSPITKTLERVLMELPPPIFHSELFLKEKQAPDSSGKKNIPYNQLSSGELQFLQTLTVHLDHIHNLASLQPKSTQYKAVNLIFDELEICFHPEYQRQFVSRLINLIRNLGYNKIFEFNIILLTHSPFILSDIPSSNILYLKTDSENIYPTDNPFAANINDILKNGFFLKSFMGEFAQRKIKDYAEQLKNKENADSVIMEIQQVIGDRFIRYALLHLTDEGN